MIHSVWNFTCCFLEDLCKAPSSPHLILLRSLYLYSPASVQLSRVRLCDPMNCSVPGLPVHHQLPEFTQTHVHQVGDAIQPSHPRSHPLLLPACLHSTYCWTSLTSATFCHRSLVFSHPWVPKIPSATLNMLSPKILETNWPDFISLHCSYVYRPSDPASLVNVEFTFAESIFPVLARESNPYCFT